MLLNSKLNNIKYNSIVGVDAQGAAALMTPERLATVVGGLLPVATTQTNGLASKYTAIDYYSCYNKKCILLHKSSTNQYTSISFSLVVSIEGIADCLLHFGGTTGNGTSGKVIAYKLNTGVPIASQTIDFYYQQDKDGAISIYAQKQDEKPFGTVFMTKRLDYVGNFTSQQMTGIDSIDVSILTKITIK